MQAFAERKKTRVAEIRPMLKEKKVIMRQSSSLSSFLLTAKPGEKDQLDQAPADYSVAQLQLEEGLLLNRDW
jgi:hypothetical protein